MYRGKTVGVVVPAYDEEGFVGEVIDTLPEFVDRAYVVDDRSTDDTWAEIQRHAAAANARPTDPPVADGGVAFDPRVVPIRHEENRGVGAAIKTGYERAREDGLDVTAVMNGDGQMNPDILHRIIEPVVSGEADYAKGNRLISPAHWDGMSRWRLFGNSVLTFLTKVASGYWRMVDPQNGYTAVSLRALERLDFDNLYDRYGFCNDVLVKLNARGLRVADVPMEAVYGDEQSGIRYTEFIPRLSALLLRGFLWRLKTRYLVYDFHPLVFLYGLGVAGGLSGLALGGLALAAGAGLVAGAFGLLFVLLGGTLCTLAMIFDKRHNESLERGTWGERR
ncbi:glycosyltransferase family 2 protein [Halostella litorea]|uniref:glycosyltransferase family 2 protein n=1 Tax=Halostella litorea TaxID=2528831 RepID=UPI00109311E2|nr:glycosyltransferase family 2 protein [Halostella litorea]